MCTLQDKLYMTMFAIFCLCLLWFGWQQLTKPDEETYGFVLIFLTPLLFVTTFGTLFKIGEMWNSGNGTDVRMNKRD